MNECKSDAEKVVEVYESNKVADYEMGTFTTRPPDCHCFIANYTTNTPLCPTVLC